MNSFWSRLRPRRGCPLLAKNRESRIRAFCSSHIFKQNPCNFPIIWERGAVSELADIKWSRRGAVVPAICSGHRGNRPFRAEARSARRKTVFLLPLYSAISQNRSFLRRLSHHEAREEHEVLNRFICMVLSVLIRVHPWLKIWLRLPRCALCASARVILLGAFLRSGNPPFPDRHYTKKFVLPMPRRHRHLLRKPAKEAGTNLENQSTNPTNPEKSGQIRVNPAKSGQKMKIQKIPGFGDGDQ